MKKRIHNFNAGPSALPLEVLEEIQKDFLNFQNSGMSIVEISHRSNFFDDVINDSIARIKNMLDLGDDFEVLFLQGGASMQFAMIPMNLLSKQDSADYVDTGTWSNKAIVEMEKQNKKISIVASSEDKNFSYIPQNIPFNKDASFVHITSNNTIKGTQWHKFPNTNNVPIVADMSSDIMSRPLPINKFGLIYAGAQKNIGIAGTCLVIIRKTLLDKIPNNIPSMLNYKTYVAKNSMYNTPPCFAIYTMWLVLKWIEKNGGLIEIDKRNKEKANFLYDFIDNSNLYNGTAEEKSRSLMNVTFLLKDKNLEKKFIAEAISIGLGGLKGHRSVGGCRASIYNATSFKSVQALVEFMKKFEITLKGQ